MKAASKKNLVARQLVRNYAPSQIACDASQVTSAKAKGASMRARLFFCVAAIGLLLAEAGAAPLDAESCTKLKGEQALLDQTGVRGNMAKGPQWAKANLAADKVEQIRRLIEVDEQLLFRCTGKSLVELPPELEADPAAPSTEANDDAKDAPAGASKADKKAPPAADKAKPAQAAKPQDDGKAKPAPVAKAPAAPAKGEKPAKQEGAQPPPDKAATVKPKPKPKPKVDDAYKAQPADPKANPFATQTTPAAKN